jgi:hypothetical protein
VLRGAAFSFSPRLAWPIELRVHDPHVSSERIVSRKRLLFLAQVAAHLHLARVVDRVLVPRQVVGP